MRTKFGTVSAHGNLKPLLWISFAKFWLSRCKKTVPFIFSARYFVFTLLILIAGSEAWKWTFFHHQFKTFPFANYGCFFYRKFSTKLKLIQFPLIFHPSTRAHGASYAFISILETEPGPASHDHNTTPFFLSLPQSYKKKAVFGLCLSKHYVESPGLQRSFSIL